MKHEPTGRQQSARGAPVDAEKAVFRSIAFPVSAFDYLKAFQREHERTHGERLNNNEALALILSQHRTMTTEESEERGRMAERA